MTPFSCLKRSRQTEKLTHLYRISGISGDRCFGHKPIKIGIVKCNVWLDKVSKFKKMIPQLVIKAFAPCVHAASSLLILPLEWERSPGRQLTWCLVQRCHGDLLGFADNQFAASTHVPLQALARGIAQNFNPCHLNPTWAPCRSGLQTGHRQARAPGQEGLCSVASISDRVLWLRTLFLIPSQMSFVLHHIILAA